MSKLDSIKHSHNFQDLTGKKFGRLTVIRVSHKNKKGVIYWECFCDCGKKKNIAGAHLRSGNTESCGCIFSEMLIKRNIIHGKTGTKCYSSWSHMRRRCYDKNDPAYKDYGCRGIKVCKRWRDSFVNFYKDMGNKPHNMSLERIDNNKSYSSNNCKWATPKDQANNRRSNINLTYNNQTKNIMEWSKILNIKYPTLRNRIGILNWPIEKAFLTPVRGSKHKK